MATDALRCSAGLLAVVVTVAALAQEPSTPPITGTETLEQLLARLPEANPDIRARRHEVEAARQRLPQAWALPEPTLTYGFWPRQDDMAADPPDHRIGVMQGLPGPGKRALRADRVDAEIAAAQHRLDRTTLEVSSDFRTTYYEACILERTIAITRENLALVTQFEALARSRFRTGEALADVLKAQVEMGRIENEALSMEALREPLRAALNALLGRPADAALAVPSDLPGGALAAVAPGAFLAAASLEANPELDEWAAQVRGAEVGVRQARRERVPDVTLGLEYESDRPWSPNAEGSDMVFASISVTLPIWSRLNRSRIAEAAAQAAALREARQGRANRLQAEWQRAVYRLRDAERRMALYEGQLLPRARQSVEVSRQAYEVGKADFTALIDAQRMALDLQTVYEQARLDRAQALAEAERLAGRRLVQEGP